MAEVTSSVPLNHVVYTVTTALNCQGTPSILPNNLLGRKLQNNIARYKSVRRDT
jgi:hypothetical protein